MSVLDRLYRLEIEFHRLYRSEGLDARAAAGVHTSYALQNHYEPLLRTVGVIEQAELEAVAGRMKGDPRDVRAAYRSLRQFLRVA